MKVLLIIPAYNEAENIAKTVRSVEDYKQTSDYVLDYVVINDGSGDNTAEVCREKGIPCISLAQNLGIGGAVQTGYLYAEKMGYDIAVQFDGDGQHDIRSLANILGPIERGEADFVVGSRFLGGESAFRSTRMRRLGIRWLSSAIRLFAGIHIHDVTSGFRAAGRKAIALLAKDYPIDYPEPESIVYLKKRGVRILEAQVNMFEREGGASSIRAWKSVYYMIKVTLAILVTSFQRS